MADGIARQAIKDNLTILPNGCGADDQVALPRGRQQEPGGSRERRWALWARAARGVQIPQLSGPGTAAGGVELRRERLRQIGARAWSRPSGSGDGNLWLFFGVARFNWTFCRVALWKEHSGPAPPGHMITFKNRDESDIRIDNLACISKRDCMRHNSLRNYPKSIARLIQLRGALTRQINGGDKCAHQQRQQ